MWRKGHIFLWKPANCLLPTQQSDNYLVFSEGDLTRWWGRRDLREDEHVGCSFHHSTGHPAAQLELVLCSSELLAWDFTVKWNLLMGAPWSTKKPPLCWNRPEFLIWPFLILFEILNVFGFEFQLLVESVQLPCVRFELTLLPSVLCTRLRRPTDVCLQEGTYTHWRIDLYGEYKSWFQYLATFRWRGHMSSLNFDNCTEMWCQSLLAV